LFDTFAGLPPVDAARDGGFQPGQFADTGLAFVQAALASYPNVHFCPGFFPQSAVALPADLVFKLVHLDVDLHRSTLDGLRFFYPRLLRGGLIVLHDYNDVTVPGVRGAVDEFLQTCPETLIELWDTQALIVKQ
jgi:hypothetical protein